MYAKALELVKKAHAGQVDKAGQPYINHLIAVSNGVADDTEKVIALLHDIVEDTSYTCDGLRALGFTDEIVGAVDCLTKRDNEEYKDYLDRILTNPRAVNIKLADLKHNMDINRLENVSAKDIKRVEKYEFAVSYLSANRELMRKYSCPVCGSPNQIGEIGGCDICAVCGWEDDELQRKYPDDEDGANPCSMNKAKTIWQNGGSIYSKYPNTTVKRTDG